MRLVWIVLALGACGDNTEPPRLDVGAAMPAGVQDVVFDRAGVATVRLDGGGVKRLADGRWRTVPVQAMDLGSDSDGTLLVMSGVPRVLYQVDGDDIREVGGIVIANYVHMPVQVPSGNRYVKELEGAHRSFVLSPGAAAWAESPPMFFSRPVHAYDHTLYAATPAGVQRFASDGTRPFAVTCEQLGKVRCSGLVVGGGDADTVVLGDGDEPELIVVDGTAVERIAIPGGLVPVRIAAGKDEVVVLAKKPGPDPALETHLLFALDGDTLVRIEAHDDPPTRATRLAVDHAGTVYVATQSLSTVVR